MFFFSSFANRSKKYKARKSARPTHVQLELLERRVVPSATLLDNINTVPLSSVNGTVSTTPPSTGGIAFNGNYYFAGNNGLAYEVYSTNGTTTTEVTHISNGTASTGVQQATPFAILNNELFFAANNGTNGTQIWEYTPASGSTPASTNVVTAINGANQGIGPGIAGTGVLFTVWNNRLYFAANSGASSNDYNLYSTDGTYSATAATGASATLSTHLNQYTTQATAAITSSSGGAEAAVPVNGYLLLAVNNAGTYQLWRTDGTGSGTGALTSSSGSYSLNGTTGPGQLVEYNNGTQDRVYFAANNGQTNGRQLWSSNGTSGAGTGPVVTSGITANAFDNGIFYGAAYNNPSVPGDNYLYYFGSNSTVSNGAGYQLFRTDGTSANTAQYAIISSNTTAGALAYSANPFFTVFNNKLYFVANNNTSAGNHLYVTDGTAPADTAMTSGAAALVYSGANTPAYPTVVGSGSNALLYFSANDGTNGPGLWAYDGVHTPNELDSLSTGAPLTPRSIVDVNGTAFFVGYDYATNPANGAYSPNTVSSQIYESNGTPAPAGTRLVGILNQGFANSSPSFFDTYNGETYFFANDGINGPELWETDGTTGNTKVLDDLDVGGYANGANGSSFGQGADILGVTTNGILFFRANTLANGFELYAYNTLTGASPTLIDINPGSGSSIPGGQSNQIVTDPFLAAVDGNDLFFVANDGSHGNELWESDGSATITTAGSSTGTHLVQDLNVGTANGASNSQGQYPFTFTPSGGSTLVYFVGTNNSQNYQLYSTNGTSATLVTGGFTNNTAANAPQQLTVFDGRLYFFANNGTSTGGSQLYSTNGPSTNGTYTVTEQQAPTGTYNPYTPSNTVGQQIAASGNYLYYDVNNGSSVTLYSINDIGVSPGTLINSPSTLPTLVFNGSSPQDLTPSSNGLYFYGNNGTANQWYYTNGTTTTTLTNFVNGVPGTTPYVIGNELYFTANGTANGAAGPGMELWRSDGTVAGTVPDSTIFAANSGIGSAFGNPAYFSSIGNQLLFGANDGIHGYQLWQETLTSTTLSVLPAGATTGQSANLVATVNEIGSANLGTIDSGSVTFTDTTTGNTLSTVQLSNTTGNVATFSFTYGTAFSNGTTNVTVSAGDSIKATYNGDGSTNLGYGVDFSASPAVTPFQVEQNPINPTAYYITPTTNGFSAIFDAPVAPTSVTNANVTLVNTTTNTAIAGAFVYDPTGTKLTFVAANGTALSAGNYTVTLTGGGSGITDIYGDQLSTVTYNFSVATPTGATLSVPEFSAVAGNNVYTDATGLAISLSNAAGATSVTFTLNYNANLLTLPGTFTAASGLKISTIAFSGSGAYSAVTVTVTSATNGAAITGSSGSLVLGDFVGAVVPNGATATSSLLHLSSTSVTGTPSTITTLDGVETVTTSLAVNSLTTSGSGIVLIFDAPINQSTTVLYSSPGDTTLGSADFTVIGATSGAVRGSLVVDPTNPNQVTFVRTGGPLPADTYTVTVTNAVQGVGGVQLTGNYSNTVNVGAITTPVLSVPSFARGPGQSVALSDSLGNMTAIPVNISNATNVTSASFTLTYDPTSLTIATSGALTPSNPASTAGLAITSYTITSVDTHHSILTVNLSGGSGLTTPTPTQSNPSGAEPLVTILASVPSSAQYLNKSVLNLGSAFVNGATSTGVSGVEVVAYLGDVLGTGLANATDASLVDQVGSGAGTGFSKFKDLDPSIIGGVDGSLNVNATDASLINEAGSGANVAQIPTVPSGVTLTFGGPDPYLYLTAVQGAPGQTVTETLYLDVTDPNGIQLTALDEAIGFDASALQVSDVRSTYTLSTLGSYATANTVDNTSGVFLVGQAFMGSGLPPVLPYGTDIPVLQFNVTLNADMNIGAETGLTLLQYGTVNGETQFTAVSDNEGALTWTPGKAPSNTGNAAIDGSVTAVVAGPTPTSADLVTLYPLSTEPVVVQPRLIVRAVRRVPTALVMSTPTDQPEAVLPTAKATSTVVTNVGLVAPAIGDVSPTAVEEILVANVNTTVSVVVPIQQGLSIPSSATTITPSDLPTSTGGSPAMARVTDPGVSLSLAAVGANKAAPTTSMGSATGKNPTNVLDEVYRQLGTGMGPLQGGYNVGFCGADITDDSWYPEPALIELEFGKNAEE